jgi:cytochrome c556
MRTKISRTLVLGSFLLGLTGMPLLAVADDPVAPRVAGLHEMGDAVKSVKDELKSDTPQIAVIQADAKKISDASKAMYGWFPPDTAPHPGLKTAAKQDIWDHPVEFKAAQDGLATQAAAFLAVASTGDIAKIREQSDMLGQACGNCHKQFRERPKM